MSTKPVIESLSPVAVVRLRMKAYMELTKFRLSFFVAFSAVFGFALAAGPMATWWQLLAIGFGGLLITGGANGLNQLFEKELDAKMTRTMKRPLPEGRLKDGEALVFAVLMGFSGVFTIGYFFNLPAALLGIIGLLSYSFVYTPMKRLSPFAVFVGAIPGALPPLIGWVAFTGTLSMTGWLLFAFQFFWQFPHFWAIAWLADEDYKKAGFFMLPTRQGRSRQGATFVLAYALCLAFMAFFPLQMGLIGWVGAVALFVLGLLYAVPAFKLRQQPLELGNAKRLLFASLFYLPLHQLVFWLGY